MTITFVVLGESSRFTGNQRKRLDVFHQQSEVIDQNCAVFLARGQHFTGPGQTVPSAGQLHVDQLVLRMAERGARIRFI